MAKGKSILNSKMSLVSVMAISIAAIGIAAYGLIKSKDSKRAQLSEILEMKNLQTLSRHKLLQPVTAFSEDIRYTLKRPVMPLDNQNNLIYRRDNISAGFGEFPSKHPDQRNSLPYMKISPPLDVKAATRVTVAGNSRCSVGYSNLGGGVISGGRSTIIG